MSDEKELHSVFYVDGSAKPNPGSCGAGCHGFLYDPEATIKKPVSASPNNQVITEVGYLFLDDYKTTLLPDDTDILTGVINPPPKILLATPLFYYDAIISRYETGSSNMMELDGLIHVLEYVVASDLNISKILVNTDSSYVIGVVNKIKNDKRSSWDTPVKANVSFWRRLSVLLPMVPNLILRKVVGHSGDYGNDVADRLAYLSRHKASLGKQVVTGKLSPSKGYWKPKYMKNPLLDFDHLFFTNKNTSVVSRTNEYVVMDYGSVDVGIGSSDVLFGLVRLKAPQTDIDEITSIHSEYMGSMSILSCVNLKVLYSQRNKLYRGIFGKDIYNYDKRHNTLSVLEGGVIAKTVNPPGLSAIAMSKVVGLGRLLDNYLKSTTDINMMYTDVTDYFYGINDKGKVVTLVKNGCNEMKLPAMIPDSDRGILVVLGVDLLSRNQLKRIEKLNTKITLLTRKITDKLYYYYFIVSTNNDSDVSIYCNLYSNKIHLF